MANQEDLQTIATVAEFIEWTKALEGRRILYRGLADADWKVESSASRRLKISTRDTSEGTPDTNSAKSVPDLVFQNYITRLLDLARQRGLGRQGGPELSDLELLAELQHYGAATCLIDFTTNPLIALWFACKDSSDKPGKVAALSTDSTKNFREVNYQKSKDSITYFLKENTDSPKEKHLWKWQPIDMNNRVIAQHSVFIFGTPNVGQFYKYIKISATNKEQIVKDLANLDITEENLFRDFSGFAILNAHNKPVADYTVEDNFYWGLSFHQQGDLSKAIHYYTEAIELNSKLPEVYNNRGSAKHDLDDFAGAIADYNKAISLNPHHVEAYNNRGNAKQALSDFTGAIADYDKAIEFNHKFAEAYNNRGNVKQTLDDFAGAIEDCDKAIAINPNLTEAYNNRGNAKQSLGNFAGAIADYGKSVQLKPNDAAAHYNLGVAKAKLGDLSGAIADYDKAIELNPSYARAYNTRGIAKRKSGDFSGAIADYDKAIELNPSYARAYNNRGIAKRKSGDLEGGQRDIDKALELNPDIERKFGGENDESD